MTRQVVLAASAALLCSSPVSADSPCIDVQDPQGRKLAGINVTLANWTRFTDASGRVCFPNVPPGRYQVTLRAGVAAIPCNIVSGQAATSCTLASR